MARSKAVGRKGKSKPAQPASDEKASGGEEKNQQPKVNGSTLLNECNEHFATTCLYAVLGLTKSASPTLIEIKKAYYKLSLRYHPDKVSGSGGAGDADKEDAKHKFQIIGKIYSLLGDEEKRRVYDETGAIDGEDDCSAAANGDWEQHWRTMFKKVSTDDIDKFFADYKDSAEERADLARHYEACKGDFDKIAEVAFTSELNAAEEARLRAILDVCIAKGELTKYDAYANESKKKAVKRKAHYAKEAQEAEQLKKELNLKTQDEESLKSLILARQKTRMDSLVDSLAEKYGNDKSTKSTKVAGKASARAKKAAAKDDDEDEEEDDDDENEDDDEGTEEDEDSDFESASSKKSKKQSAPKKATAAAGSKAKATATVGSRAKTTRKVKRL